MAAADRTIIVYQNNAPLKRVAITVRQTNGSYLAYDFTSKTVKLYVKNAVTDADSAARFTYISGGQITVVAPATGGLLDIQFLATDLATAGEFPFHLDAISGSNPETILTGTLEVRDT